MSEATNAPETAAAETAPKIEYGSFERQELAPDGSPTKSTPAQGSHVEAEPTKPMPTPDRPKRLAPELARIEREKRDLAEQKRALEIQQQARVPPAQRQQAEVAAVVEGHLVEGVAHVTANPSEYPQLAEFSPQEIAAAMFQIQEAAVRNTKGDPRFPNGYLPSHRETAQYIESVLEERREAMNLAASRRGGSPQGQPQPRGPALTPEERWARAKAALVAGSLRTGRR
jgi:hypothetical protein